MNIEISSDQPIELVLHEGIDGVAAGGDLYGNYPDPQVASAPMLKLSGIAATTLSGHRAIAFNPDGKLEYAEIDDPSYSHRFAGISLNASLEGGKIDFVNAGVIEEPSWNWVIGNPIFLGAGGTLTQSIPLTGLLLEVAEAIAANKIFVRVKQGIFRK